jgi:hypothetical protein
MKVNQGPILVKNQHFGIKNTIAEIEIGHGLDPESDRLGSDSRDQCFNQEVGKLMAMSVAQNWREECSVA